MAQDLEQLVLSISADTRQIQRALRKLEGDTNASTKRIERQFDSMGKKVGRSFEGIGGTARTLRASVAGIAGAFAVRETQRFVDSATRIDNALKVAGLSGDELEKVYSRLRDSAVRNAAPIEALVELYGRAALVQKELGISGEELLGFTDKIAVALRVSGKSASESSGALLQLSQALGSGVVRAEEFNSILEGSLPIAQAAAAGLKEAGGSVAKLRQLVVDGAISSEVFFRAFEAGSFILEEKVAGATFTVDQAMGNLTTAITDVAREFNTSTGAGERFAGGINKAAQAIAGFDISGFIRKIQQAGDELDSFLDRLANSSFMERFAEFVTGMELETGKPVAIETLEAEKDLAGLERQIQILKDRIEANKEMAIDTTEAEANLNGLIAKANALRAAMAGGVVDPEAARNTINSQVPFSPLSAPTQRHVISMADYDPPDSKKKKGRGAKERADEYERLTQRIIESTAATVAETEAQRQLNPLIDDYGYAIERARAEQDLLTAAQKAGKEITPQLRAEIAALADQYALATAEAARLGESQDDIRRKAEDMRDFQKDLSRSIVDGFIEGRKAADIFADALSRVGDRLLDLAFDGLFGGGTNKGFGLLGSLLGGLFGGGFKPNTTLAGFLGVPGYATGTNYHPGGLAVVGEKGPELLNLPRGSQVFRNVPQMPKLAAANQNAGPSITFAPVIDARGASVEAVARLEQVLAKQQRDFTANVVATVRTAQKRRAL